MEVGGQKSEKKAEVSPAAGRPSGQFDQKRDFGLWGLIRRKKNESSKADKYRKRALFPL